MIIPEPVLAALAKATADGVLITLPQIPDSTVYDQACRALNAAGGHRIPGGRYQFDSTTDSAQVILNDILATGEVWSPRDTGFFPTPLPVTRKLLDAAGDLAGKQLLEPSAGKGALAIPAAQAGAEVDCIEILPAFCRELEGLSLFRSVQCADFLTRTPHRGYDVVLANPPMRKGLETVHFLHAWEFVKPGGVLVSVLTDGTRWRNDRATRNLRILLDVHRAAVTPLTEVTFNFSGSQVHTVMVVLRGPPGQPLAPSTAPAPPPEAYEADGLFPAPGPPDEERTVITIDQSKIDAPDFPRTREWWRGFCPEWAAVTVHDDGTVTLESSDLHMRYTTERGVWWERDDSPKVHRQTERSLAQWIRGTPRLAVAVTDGLS